MITLKACFHFFSTKFYFSPHDSPSKTMTGVFYFILKAFCSRDIENFVFPSSPLFLPISHCFRAWSKLNLKVYDIINCLNKNLIIYFVWNLEKESYDIETLSIDIVLNKVIFVEKSYRKCWSKASPRPLFYLGKQPNTAFACKKIYLK